MPRPVRDLEPPAWADSLTAPLDGAISPAKLGDMASMSDAELSEAAGKIGEIERELSEARREIHRRIDRVQDELVGRYRSGATVDDLLA